MKRRLVLFAAIACWAAVPRGSAMEPNETFEQAAILEPGALTTGPQSFADGGLEITYADTTLGLYNDAARSILLRRSNDSFTSGDGRGSAINLTPVNRDGSVPLTVSGFPDLNFDGLDDDGIQPHPQSGNVQLTLLIWDNAPTSEPLERHVRDFALAPGEVAAFDFANEDWIGHIFTAIVDNTVDGGNDVDFWRFSGLTPGATFSARTAATTSPQGTILRLYEPSTGSVLAESINAQEGCPLGRCGTVDENGEVVVGVTGRDDFEFIGAHGARGNYTLNLSYDGDADADGDVDGDDLADLLLSFGTPLPATVAQGDFDHDDDVDRDDFAIWRMNAGAGTPRAIEGQSAGVPEPGTLILVGVSLAAWAFAFVLRRCRLA